MVHRHGVFPREYWRVALLRAYAALRRGDAGAGALAVRAFEEAARIAQPNAPLIKERELTQSLLALALETGSAAAAALQTSSLPVALAVLGRFQLTHGGRPVDIRGAQAPQLLKLVVVSGGAVHAERRSRRCGRRPTRTPDAIACEPCSGACARTHRDVVHRDGELLRSGPRSTSISSASDRRPARHWPPPPATPTPRWHWPARRSPVTAVICCPTTSTRTGPMRPREEARRTMLELLDLCAATAARRGDLDEARRMVERTIELAPHEDDRYLRVATILREQGRNGAALSVLRRARSTLDAIGVPLPPHLQEFEDSLVV